MQTFLIKAYEITYNRKQPKICKIMYINYLKVSYILKHFHIWYSIFVLSILFLFLYNFKYLIKHFFLVVPKWRGPWYSDFFALQSTLYIVISNENHRYFPRPKIRRFWYCLRKRENNTIFMFFSFDAKSEFMIRTRNVCLWYNKNSNLNFTIIIIFCGFWCKDVNISNPQILLFQYYS